MIFVTLEREIFYYYFYHKFWSVIIPDCQYLILSLNMKHINQYQ
jgi:hypothetical protein